MKPLTEDIILDVLPLIPAPVIARELIEHWPAGEDVPSSTTVARALQRLEKRGLVVRNGPKTKPRFTLVKRETTPRQLTDGEVNWVAIKKEMGL